MKQSSDLFNDKTKPHVVRTIHSCPILGNGFERRCQKVATLKKYAVREAYYGALGHLTFFDICRKSWYKTFLEQKIKERFEKEKIPQNTWTRARGQVCWRSTAGLQIFWLWEKKPV